MLILENYYLEYCDLNKLEILSVESANSFLKAESTINPDDLLKAIDNFELQFDPRKGLNNYLVPGLCKILKHPRPIFRLYNLSLRDDLSITERQEEMDLLTLPFLSRHTLGHLKRNDFIAVGMYITECLKCEQYKHAREFGAVVFETKYKNEYLKNFFDSYIKIFSNEEIDPKTEFDRFKFGFFDFLSDVLYFLYYLREEEKELAKGVLTNLDFDCKEIYYLFGLGFCSTKIDITSTPSIQEIKKFGKIDPSLDLEGYEKSVLNLVLFLKLTCSYVFKYFYNYQTVLTEVATENLSLSMDVLTTQDKLLAVAIMVVGLHVLETTGTYCLVKIEDVKKAISFASQEKEKTNEEDDLKYFVKFMSNDEKEFNNSLINLENHDFISDLDFEKGTFVATDELFIFTNTFSVSLLAAFKNNPDLIEENDLDDFSIAATTNDDFKDHES